MNKKIKDNSITKIKCWMANIKERKEQSLQNFTKQNNMKGKISQKGYTQNNMNSISFQMLIKNRLKILLE